MVRIYRQDRFHSNALKCRRIFQPQVSHCEKHLTYIVETWCINVRQIATVQEVDVCALQVINLT